MTIQQIAYVALIVFILTTVGWMTWYGIRVGNSFEFNKIINNKEKQNESN
jgi:hypothetical protein